MELFRWYYSEANLKSDSTYFWSKDSFQRQISATPRFTYISGNKAHPIQQENDKHLKIKLLVARGISVCF